ncbi:MAG: Trp biosynthesis-associated membrane protein [Microlunatus sp.]|nr:Trp biosynthesis-associated membrane protein [Microlunatus sp.]
MSAPLTKDPARPATGRSRTVGFALLVLGAIAVVGTATTPWYLVDARTRFSGTAITGGVAQALGVAVLAGSLLMITLRTLGRRVVAAVIGMIGIVAVILLPWQQPDSAEVFAELRKHSLADSYQLHATGGSIGFAISWLAVIAGAVVVIMYAGRWPQRAGRFERDADRATGMPVGPDGEPDTGAIWKAIDAGQDPTQDPSQDRGDRSGPS